MSIKRNQLAWPRLVGLVAMHMGCLGLIWVQWSVFCIVAAVAMYLIRAFALTAFYHRYFSHRAFKTSRVAQFAGALVGVLAMQKGPLWWAAHHRHHHKESDEHDDVHSPVAEGFFWSHIGWIVAKRNSDVRNDLIPDWLAFPELKWLEKYSLGIGFAFGICLFAFGQWLDLVAPALRAAGPSLLVWVFFVSTVSLYHATYAVNSIAHLFGSRQFNTNDNSRNNFVVALLTLGEGWHNNHHRYQSSARQGFLWWQIDVTYYVLLLLRNVGLVWDLRPVPQSVLSATNPNGRRQRPLGIRASPSTERDCNMDGLDNWETR